MCTGSQRSEGSEDVTLEAAMERDAPAEERDASAEMSLPTGGEQRAPGVPLPNLPPVMAVDGSSVTAMPNSSTEPSGGRGLRGCAQVQLSCAVSCCLDTLRYSTACQSALQHAATPTLARITNQLREQSQEQLKQAWSTRPVDEPRHAFFALLATAHARLRLTEACPKLDSNLDMATVLQCMVAPENVNTAGARVAEPFRITTRSSCTKPLCAATQHEHGALAVLLGAWQSGAGIQGAVDVSLMPRGRCACGAQLQEQPMEVEAGALVVLDFMVGGGAGSQEKEFEMTQRRMSGLLRLWCRLRSDRLLPARAGRHWH